VVAVVIAGILGYLVRPAADSLPQRYRGDASLAALARARLGSDTPAVAVACLTPRSTRTATIGVDPGTRFEIGSISKGLTGLLFADMVRRGEVKPTTTVAELLPMAGPVESLSLAQLATHTSGLPPQPDTGRQLARNLWSTLAAGNPYAGTVDQRLAALRRTSVKAPPGTYSNAGFELLGAALASAAGVPYRQLLTERVLKPVGMNDTIVPDAESELEPRDLYGQTPGGRTADPWLGPAIGPAGGARADIDDMARLARALLDGSAPGIDALDPRAAYHDDAIGWAWLTTRLPEPDRTVVWHNGGTGGFTAFLGLDRKAGTAVVALSALGEPPSAITLAGLRMLHEEGGCR
jgi:CubicO group peptidase (beta-lactamase class C family)